MCGCKHTFVDTHICASVRTSVKLQTGFDTNGFASIFPFVSPLVATQTGFLTQTGNEVVEINTYVMSRLCQ